MADEKLMAGDDWLLTARYSQQQIVRERNSAGLLSWSAYLCAETIPPAADNDWIRLRIVAERIPTQPDQYTQMTMAFFQQDPATVQAIRTLLSPWNDPATEQTLADQITAVIGAFMPRFSAQQVSDADVTNWRVVNNVPAPP